MIGTTFIGTVGMCILAMVVCTLMNQKEHRTVAYDAGYWIAVPVIYILSVLYYVWIFFDYVQKKGWNPRNFGVPVSITNFIHR
mgnify:CR=1 FL=1